MTKMENFYRGDTLRYKIILEDKEGNKIDLTGASIWFTLKKSINDTDDNAAIQIKVTQHSDPTNGETEIVVPASETNSLEPGSYFYDFQLVDSSGNVKTLLAGKVKVLPDVTRRIS